MVRPSGHSTGPQPVQGPAGASLGSRVGKVLHARLANGDEATFEELIEVAVGFHTGGRDWRSHAWPAEFGLANLRQSINPKLQLPPWQLVVSLLQQLAVPTSWYAEFKASYDRAKLYRPWSESMHVISESGQPATYVINQTGGSLNLYSTRPRRERTGENSVMPDAEGYTLKPDPFGAQTIADLEDRLRAYWEWAGRPSSRKIAGRSDGIFSHATVLKIIDDKKNKPKLKMEYVLGIIRGCKGDEADQQRWVTAWRILDQADRKNHRVPSVHQRMRVASEALNQAGPDGALPDTAKQALRGVVDSP